MEQNDLIPRRPYRLKGMTIAKNEKFKINRINTEPSVFYFCQTKHESFQKSLVFDPKILK